MVPLGTVISGAVSFGVLAGVFTGVCYLLVFGLKWTGLLRAALTDSTAPAAAAPAKTCARCGRRLSALTLGYARRLQCAHCRLPVCRHCCARTTTRRWLCVSCRKLRDVRLQSGEWFYQQLRQRFRSTVAAISNSDKNDGEVREFMARLIEGILGAGLDDVALYALSDQPHYTNFCDKYKEPLVEALRRLYAKLKMALSDSVPQDGETACDLHAELKDLIKQMIHEARTHPPLSEENGESSWSVPSGSSPEPLDQRSYEDILATAILNKICSKYQRDKPRRRQRLLEKTVDRNSNLLSSKLTASMQEAVGRSDSQSEDSDSVTNSNDEYSWSESSHHEPLSVTIEECIEEITTRYSSDEDEPKNELDRFLSTLHYIKRQRAPFPEFGKDVVDGGMSSSEEAEGGSEGEEGEATAESVSVNPVDSWEENWLFQRRKLKTNMGTCQPVPVPMLVPNPTTDLRAMIGGIDADEMSDLSDCSDSVLEDLVDGPDDKKYFESQFEEGSEEEKPIECMEKQREVFLRYISDDLNQLIEPQLPRGMSPDTGQGEEETNSVPSEVKTDEGNSTRSADEDKSAVSGHTETAGSPTETDSSNSYSVAEARNLSVPVVQVDSGEGSLDMQQEGEYTVAYATLAQVRPSPSPTSSPSPVPKPRTVLSQSTSESAASSDTTKSEHHQVTKETKDDNTSPLPELSVPPKPGTIAEREHLKWEKAPPLANNPYSKENIERRQRQRMYLSRHSSSENSIEFPELTGTKEPSLQEIDCKHRRQDYNKYVRDYYVNVPDSEVSGVEFERGGKMEAVPRLPMVSFDLKVSPDRQHTDFSKLKQYIRDFYHEDPESYSTEIHKLESLRAMAMRPANDATGCSVLKMYYCQLHFLQSRFPMGKDGAAAVNFTWRDTYANMVCTLADIRFEIVSVLYNIGALHSQLGASDLRSTSEGLKLACTHFQCAAYAFQHLKDTYPQPTGVDLAPDLMQFMYQVCLAQAQECILEKSMTDNRKATINAKVAAQIVDYYNMAMNALSHGGSDDSSVLETVGSKLFKSWKRYVKFKLTYYGCIALLYQGQQSEEQQKMGERMAYYQAAFDKLVEATKLTKGLDHPEVIEEALTFTMDVVEGKRKAAKNENEFIYHEEVPDKEALPEIKGASLVKGIPFDVTDPEISGPDIFGRLVPMKAHEVSSLYSEEKAKLLRRVGGLVDDKDQELVAFMSSLQLECVNAHMEPDRLPQDIVDRCAALSAKPDAIQMLIEAMDKLSDIYQDVEAMLKEIMELIQEEEVEEKEYQQVMGSRPPSIVATDLTREAKKYEEAHHKAAESNNTLHKAMTQHIANLRLLELPLAQLAQQIPSVVGLNLGEQPVVREMQMLVGKVDEMRRQRAMLASQLRESVCADDITTQLVTRQHDNLEAIFQEELQKHMKYVSLIEQNLAAQDNILKALTETYAQYAPIRKTTMEVMRQRNLTLSALISSYDAYEDLIAKTNKGQEFYKKLETNVTKLHQRVKGTCKVQQEERDTILAKNCKTLPSKVKPTIDDVTPYVPPRSSSGGPKLKDYLDNYKRDKSGGYTAHNPGGQINDPYYNTSLPSKPSGYPESVSAPYDASQPWVPSVRPAPVGQEGTTPSTTSQDVKSEPSYPSYTPNYPSYPPSKNLDATQYPQNYASYMNQYQQYTSPYQMPSNYPKNDVSAYSMQTHGQGTNQNAVNYPPTTPSPQLPNTGAGYPPPAPSPIGQTGTAYPIAPSPVPQKYPTSYDAYKQPTEIPQGYNDPTAGSHQGYNVPSASQQGNLPGQQGYNTSQTGSVATTLPQGYSATQQGYPHQSYQPSSQNMGYSGHPLPQTNLQQMPVQYPSGSQAYSTQNIPQMQNYPATTVSPQHYPASNVASQAANYQTPSVNQSSSYPSYPTYPTPVTSLSQTSVTQSQQPVASVPMDQNLPPTHNSVQNFQSGTGASYSTQNPTGIPPHDKQSGQGMYPQYQTPTANHPTMYPTPVSQGATPSALAQPGNPGNANQYSSYIPQIYNSYTNDKVSQANTVPWVSAQPQEMPQNYYANQYNYSQAGTEMQYTPATAASFYSCAGQNSGYQTSASIAQATNQNSQPTYTQGNYYYQPYGYQYTSGSLQNSITVESPSRVAPSQPPPQGQITPQSPMTYMQASSSNFTLTSANSSTSLSGENNRSSNVDLLAGLDFSVSQDPLVPQSKSEMSVKPVETPAKQSVSQETNVVEKLAAVTLSENSSTSFKSSMESISSVESKTSTDSVYVTPKTSSEDKVKKKFYIKDPFNDTEALNQFVQEVEKFEKFVEGLVVKTLNGPTPLDIKWKELVDLKEKDSASRSISVARCYPVKNRFPDILPYDNSRVELPSTKDDYINASYVKDVTSNFPDFIVTQMPLPSTFGDFWTMVLEQQVELIVCLLNDAEVEEAGGRYWPTEKGVEMTVGRVKLTLQTCNTCKHWVERIIYVTDTRLTRAVVHLHFTEWPGSSFPSSPGPFLSLVSESLNVISQQRGSGPGVVHCLSGVGRSGLFLLTVAVMCHIQGCRNLPDLVTLADSIARWHRNPLRDREHFRFSYQTLLYYAQDLLMKRGILASRSSFEEKRTKSHTRHPSEDFLLGPPKDVKAQESPEKKQTDGSTTDASSNPSDPLSQLDPLWSLKRPQ